MDHHSKWDTELEKKTKRLKFTGLVLAKLNKILSPTNLLTIMYEICYSIATHSILAWESALKTHIQKFLALHQKII